MNIGQVPQLQFLTQFCFWKHIEFSPECCGIGPWYCHIFVHIVSISYHNPMYLSQVTSRDVHVWVQLYSLENHHSLMYIIWKGSLQLEMISRWKYWHNIGSHHQLGGYDEFFFIFFLANVENSPYMYMYYLISVVLIEQYELTVINSDTSNKLTNE